MTGNSTNVEPHVRAGLVGRARLHRRPIVALPFLPDLDTCPARNRMRPANRQGPDNTLRWQHALAAEATADALLAEGFTAVHQIATNPYVGPLPTTSASRSEQPVTGTDPHENTPTAMVYDIFAETANDLIGRYTHLSDTSDDEAEREQWWQQALAVRDARRAVKAQDREELLEHIARWKAEAEALRGSA
ncbi:hypothetical protein ACFCX0_48570 [Streptomyces sp. NPDC056352]|uniref:hypothetical protein n=1 Tax=Streptomyces sp. NPDC056352 TaxID=3345791 RepID=UPI0035DDB593